MKIKIQNAIGMCKHLIFYKFQRVEKNPNFVACCSVFDCLFVFCVIQFIQRVHVFDLCKKKEKILKNRKKCEKNELIILCGVCK